MDKLYKDIDIKISGCGLTITTDNLKVVDNSYNSYEELLDTICRVIYEIWKV